MSTPGVTRREFVATTGAATVGALAANGIGSAQAKKRYAIVGTGDRGTSMWGRPIVERYSDVVDFVGLCDINPLRVEVAKRRLGVSCPTFTSLDEMIDKAQTTAVIGTGPAPAFPPRTRPNLSRAPRRRDRGCPSAAELPVPVPCNALRVR